MNKKQKWLLRISIIANLIFGIIFFLNYTAYSYKLGELKENVKVRLFTDKKDSVFFVLPKGLTVRDVSERGISAIGQFENNRFDIVITTDRDDLIDYNIPKEKLLPFGNYYSADSSK